MIAKKQWMKFISAFLTVLILFTLVTSTFAAEINISTNIHSFTSSTQTYPDKISGKVTDEFKNEKYVTYLIKLSEQPDVMGISNHSLHEYKSKNVTARTAILKTRDVVVNSLRETSTRTQASLINYLEGKKASGDVKDYKSFYIVNSMAITSTKQVMEEMAKHNEVAKILPNEMIQLDDNQSTVSESSKNESGPSSIESTDPNVQWDINLIGAPKVWNQGIDGNGIVIGSLDTGVDYTHPALYTKWRAVDENGKVLNPELSWFDPTPRHTILPFDGIGHGTHTMGIMVGSEENGTHKIGVAPGAKWMSARIFDSSGRTTTEILLQAGQWMLAPVDSEGNLHPELAPDVINNSWGGGPGLDEFYRPIVQAWKAANIVPVFSSGNTNTPYKAEPGTVANPANYPESFAVGATDKYNNLADFSLRGPSPYGEVKPDVSAPGVKVLSSYLNGSYVEEDGTSMAGPIVAGVAALMLQQNASLDVDQLENIIKQTATPMTNNDYKTSPNNGYGYGIVNAFNAVKALTSGLGTISGKITTPGEDLEKPVIEYTPIKLAFTNDDQLHLNVTVSDNVNIGTVEAFARITGEEGWTPIQMDQIAGDNKHGVFQGFVPTVLVTTAGIEYYFKVTDFGNNQVTTDINTITITDGITPGYFQDFEDNFDGYKIEGKNSSWQWGEPTRGPDSAFSGKKVVGTNLSGSYDPNAIADLQLPTINLLDSPGGAILSFKQWFDLEQDRDFGTVYISANSTGNEYIPIDTITSFNAKWETKYIDLSSYGGQQVKVKLELTSDDDVQNLGWYIDDVSLETDQTPPGAPSNLSGYADPLNFINLKWDAPNDDDVSYYNVYRSTTPGSGYEVIGGSQTPDFVDTWLDGPGPFYYVVTAVDYSGNESVYSNEISVSLESNPQVIYQDNFDGSDDNGWTHSGTNDEWQRGKPQGGPSKAYSAPNVWGTDLAGNYEDNSDYSLYSPVIDLTNTIHPIVTFQDWFQIQGYTYGKPLDNVSFEISVDGGASWGKILDYNGLYGNSWWQDGFSLEDYKGEKVQFRFHLTSNENLNYAGFYLDDFQVLDVNGETATKILSNNRPNLQVAKSSEQNKFQKTTAKAATNEGSVSGLPIIGSTVTILETGQSVITDPRNGVYKINALPGTYTVRAEAYGYYPEDRTITIKDHETSAADFSLKPIPHGMIQGVITNQKTGEPISNARIMVMEDARVSPVYTDSEGVYTLDVMAGDYTLAVTAPDFYDQQVHVTVAEGQTANVHVGLKSFTGLSGELGYDDGSMEGTTVLNKAGTLQAVLMTPETYTTEVTGAKIMFFGERFPAPGGTDFKFAIYDATGPKGAPGKMIAGPIKGTALRNGDWTTVHFDTGVITHGDFYIAVIQTADYPYCPGLGNDTDGTYNGRGWIYIDGGWTKALPQQGNLMIRALVKNEVNAPVITSPANKSYTKESNVTVSGTSSANDKIIKLYNGSSFVGTGIVKNGQFSIPTILKVGTNELTVKAEVEGKETDSSLPVMVTLDQTAPVVTVTAPGDGYYTNKEVVTVTGSVIDDNLSSLEVNDQKAVVGSDRSFSQRVIVDPGENTITVKATDFAGNETVVIRKVFSNPNLGEGGDNPPLPSNSAPTAHDVKVTGTPKAGSVLTGAYTYHDTENDAEGASIIKWYRAEDKYGKNKQLINGATSHNYTLTAEDQGKFISMAVTPVAKTGATSGTEVNSDYIAIEKNAAPTASHVKVAGTPKVGIALKGSYTYQDADNDQEGSTIIKWYRADDSRGKNKKVIIGATSKSYLVTNADQGKYISMEVTPVAKTGETKGDTVSSGYVAIPKTAAPNTAPTATNLKVQGIAKAGSILKAVYTYKDKENDKEGTSIIQWFRADDIKGKNKKAIPGAKGTTYKLAKADSGKFISFTVIPVAKTGEKIGKVVSSSSVPVIK